jgi:hypothetical protein
VFHTTFLAAAVAVAAYPADAGADEPVAVIDLRALDAGAARAGRTDVAQQLERERGLSLIDDAALAAALTGEPFDPMDGEAADALASAKSSYGSLDCSGAAAAGERAINALAAVQASGGDVKDRLVQAYVYVLLCSASDPARARAVAHRLRALDPTLGADPPPGVSDEVWAKYPPIDATSNVYMVELNVLSEPKHAQIWIDHELAGTAPVSVHIEEGEHIVAAANETGSAVLRIPIRGRDARIENIELTPRGSSKADAIRAWVDGWRTGTRTPTPHNIHELLTTAGVRVGFLLTTNTESGETRVEAWSAAPKGSDEIALLIGAGRLDQVPEVAAMVRDRLSGGTGGGAGDQTPVPDPDGGGEDTYKSKPWWIYASIVGAVVLGGAVIIASDLADDTQVIRLSYP